VLAWVIEGDRLGFGAALWADKDGWIFDVADTDDFVCLLAPGEDDDIADSEEQENP
jgi:hypothetical protein